MAEYSKKLHVLKNDVVTDIKLYTTAEEVGSPSFHMLDGTTEVYAKLGEVSDANASPLRVLYSGTTYAVLIQAGPPTGSTTTPIITSPPQPDFTLVVPANITVIKATMVRGEEIGNISCIGVTPGKTYILRGAVDTSQMPYQSGSSMWNTANQKNWIGCGGYYGAGLNWAVRFDWSPDINNSQTLNVTDY